MVVSNAENKRKQVIHYQSTRKKELTPMEQLEYKVAMLERELLKKNRLSTIKKINRTEGAMPKKVIQQIYAYIEQESEIIQ